MPDDTEKIQAEQKSTQSLVNDERWGVVRSKLVEKIQDLQNAFNIQDSDPTKMLVDLQSRKLATDILVSWLREVEGTADQASQIPQTGSSYIIRG